MHLQTGLKQGHAIGHKQFWERTQAAYVLLFSLRGQTHDLIRILIFTWEKKFASSQENATVSTHDKDLIRIWIFIWCQLAKILPSPVYIMQLYQHTTKVCKLDCIMQHIMLIGVGFEQMRYIKLKGYHNQTSYSLTK